MSDEERMIITKLYKAEAIQLIICSYKMCWEIELTSYIVAIQGV